MSSSYVVFSHGRDSEPWGAKITAMAQIARRHGLAVESVDYRGIDDMARVARLLEVGRELPGELILVGSSLGGLVSAAAAAQLPTRGLFLLAPAFYMAGYDERYTCAPPRDRPVAIVHGWNDDVVPAANSIRYAQRYKCTLHLLDSDHRLTANLEEVCDLFDHYLQRLQRRA